MHGPGPLPWDNNEGATAINSLPLVLNLARYCVMHPRPKLPHFKVTFSRRILGHQFGASLVNLLIHLAVDFFAFLLASALDHNLRITYRIDAGAE